MRRSEFWIATVCLLSVLALGPLRAVMIAFLISVIDVIRRASRPVTSALLEAPDGSHFLPTDDGQAAGSSGLMVYLFGAPLYLANATLFWIGYRIDVADGDKATVSERHVQER